MASGRLGRRYRRQDEAGPPFCITVDGQLLTDGTVTVRDRDSLKQWRVQGRKRFQEPLIVPETAFREDVEVSRS